MKTKKIFLSLLLATVIFVPAHLGAQVTIGSVEPPQATLDIRGNPEERGQGFRLVDGNQSSGRVLTAVGNDGMGTWLPSAITVYSTSLTRRTPNASDTQTFPFVLGAENNHQFVDSHHYVYLEPGLYMVFIQSPVAFNFPLESGERIRYDIGFIRAGATAHNFHRLHFAHGAIHPGVPIRQMQMGIFDTRGDAGRTKYYVVYRNFIFWNEDGNVVGAAALVDRTVTINVSGFAHSIFLVPMNQ